MTYYLKFLLKYTAFWYMYFIILKIIFLIYHYTIFSGYPVTDLMRVFVSGAILDISFISYILMFPTVMCGLAIVIEGKVVQKILRYYTLGILIVLSLLMVVDLEVLKWWGIRADKTILKYLLQVPEEIFATASVVPVYMLTAIFIALVSAFALVSRFCLYRKPLPDVPIGKLPHIALFLFMAASLIIPIRGGIQQIPVNQSSAYFSYHHHLNLAAVNFAWNFGNSLFDKSTEAAVPYSFDPVPNSIQLFESLYADKKDRKSDNKVLRKEKPNILLIVWESFTYKVLDDPRNLTPGFNNLRKQGLFFPNLYATGDRSDKGLTGILSGYPAMPKFSIMNKPEKSAKLPCLSHKLHEQGYTSAFYYGGEPDFANLKSYLLTSQYGDLVFKNNFPKSLHTSKWGVHDEHLFQRLHEDIAQKREPFFITAFTLSSHEPYDVPLSYISGQDNESKFCNSIFYTDSCLTSFISKARKQDWWDNTLVIVIADHGHILPGKNQWATRASEEFRIPMLWLGGALTQPGLVETLGGQTDLAATLLAQLDIDYSDFRFSKDLLNPAREFAFYTFNNGFGYITPEDFLVYDNTGNNIIHQGDSLSEETIQTGKAYLEVSFRDYMEK